MNKTKILSLVSQILAENAISEAPIPIEKIIQSMGLELRFEPFNDAEDPMSGVLFKDDTNLVIGINPNENPNRQRFTMAHELGHFLLHQKENMHIDTRSSVFLRKQLYAKATDQKEIEANLFAAELLMPKKIIEAELGVCKKEGRMISDEEIIENLAIKFKVSAQAMAFRLLNLKFIKID